MKNVFKIAVRVLACMIAILLCALLVFFIIPLTKTEDTTSVDGSADWMATLDDSLR